MKTPKPERYTIIYNTRFANGYTGAVARVLTRDLNRTLKNDRFVDPVRVFRGWPKEINA